MDTFLAKDIAQKADVFFDNLEKRVLSIFVFLRKDFSDILICRGGGGGVNETLLLNIITV